MWEMVAADEQLSGHSSSPDVSKRKAKTPRDSAAQSGKRKVERSSRSPRSRAAVRSKSHTDSLDSDSKRTVKEKDKDDKDKKKSPRSDDSKRKSISPRQKDSQKISASASSTSVPTETHDIPQQSTNIDHDTSESITDDDTGGYSSGEDGWCQ